MLNEAREFFCGAKSISPDNQAEQRWLRSRALRDAGMCAIIHEQNNGGSMYQIIGVQRNQQQRLVATPTSAREALTHYRASQRLFTNVIIQSPEGETIDGFELNRRADAERAADNTESTT